MPMTFANRSGLESRRGPRAAASRGFTLTELMIAVAVLGVLTAVGLPSMTNFVREQRVKTATSDVFASLIYARSEAIKRAADVIVVPNNTAAWAAGWKVTDAGGASLRVQDAIGGVTVTGPAASLTFRRDGRLATGVTNFVLTSPDNSAITARCVRLDPSGRANIKVDSNGNSGDGCQ